MPKIKVLPVYPEFPVTFWSFKYAVEYVGKKSSMPPTGLATVVAMLPSQKFDVHRIVDLNVESLTDEQIKSSDLIFTSSMIVQEGSHNEVIDRAHFYGKKVVAGGPFPTSYWERNRKADHVVAGEAEITLGPFLEDLLSGNARERYDEKDLLRGGRVSVEVRKNGKPIITGTPVPRWDLVDLEKYFSAAIQYSRGCPFDCDFCDITKLYGREPRTKTPGQMINEFEALRNRGFSGDVFIVDDNFIGNSSNLRKFLPVVIDWQERNNYPFSFFTEASMNLAWDSNKDILEDMVKAGFSQVFLGIESVDEEVLKNMKKQQNVRMNPLEAVRRIQEAGLEVTGGFIVGNDGDRKDVFDNLYKFIQEAGIVIPMPGLLTALNGTDLYKRLEREGRLRGDSMGNNTHHLGFNFEPKLDEEFLISGYVGLLERLFNPKNYYERCRVLQDRLGKSIGGRKIGWSDVSAFGKSVKRQLFARGGLEYSKHLISAAITSPRQFPKAVTQAIKLDHFGKLTRATSDVYNYREHTESLYRRFRLGAKRIVKRRSDEIHRLSEIASSILHKAERRYETLHDDFKSDAFEYLESLRNRVNELADSLRKRYSSA